MKISYGITVHKEHEELNQLLELLINETDRMVLLFQIFMPKKLLCFDFFLIELKIERNLACFFWM